MAWYLSMTMLVIALYQTHTLIRQRTATEGEVSVSIT